MRVELSPGEWAGVINAVSERARTLRSHAGNERPDVATDLHEQADDLDRIAGIIREHIAADGRQLPEVPPGAPGTTAACPSCGSELYVRMHEIEFRRNAEWTADGSVILGKWDSSDSGDEPSVLACPQGCGDYALPDVGDYS